jgi:hypothetical protein
LQTNKLHIVAFDVPEPPDYGGAIDVYYKVKALAIAGVEIYLHCFTYGNRERATELEAICKQVFYYPRRMGLKGLSMSKPYIVSSRNCPNLLHNLVEIVAPIFFEGLHTTYYLTHSALADRFKIVRTHNIEHDYYRQLYKKGKGFIKRSYFLRESEKLKRYEQRLSHAQVLMSLSTADDKYFGSAYPSVQHVYLPPFHAYDKLQIKTGRGGYCLYHGNLAHPENIEAVHFLLNHVAPKVKLPFLIAGRNPSPKLAAMCAQVHGCQLISNPGAEQMKDLLQNAQVIVLPTYQVSGMKLKLLDSLYSGRHVLVNNQMLHGTGLNDICHIANQPIEFIDYITDLAHIPFTVDDVISRSVFMVRNFDNAINAQKIIACLPHL